MAPKSSNRNTYSNTYNDGFKLGLERLSNQMQQPYFININIKTLSSLVGILREYVKLYMNLLTAKRYYALNDRITNFLSQGEIDMSATTAELGSAPASNTVVMQILSTCLTVAQRLRCS